MEKVKISWVDTPHKNMKCLEFYLEKNSRYSKEIQQQDSSEEDITLMVNKFVKFLKKDKTI